MLEGFLVPLVHQVPVVLEVPLLLVVLVVLRFPGSRCLRVPWSLWFCGSKVPRWLRVPLVPLFLDVYELNVPLFRSWGGGGGVVEHSKALYM